MGFSRLASPRGAWLLLLAIVVLRAPGLLFGIVDIDESDLVVIGRILGEGGLPYVDFAEKKPLLLYLFYAPAALFGWQIWPMQVMAIGWCFATSLVVGRATRCFSGSIEAGAAAAWLCGLASACNVLSVNAELLLNLPAAAAMLFFLRAERGGGRRDDLLAGLCCALATLFKHQAGITLFAMEAALVYDLVVRRRGLQLARQACLGLGFLVPWAVAAGLYVALGEWDAFYEWNVSRNLSYSVLGAGPAGLRLLAGVGLSVLFAAPLLWWAALRETRVGARHDGARVFLLASVWLTWVPVSLGGRFYSHYFLQFVPSLAILAGPYLAERLIGWPRLRRAARLWVVLGLALPVGSYTLYALTRGAIGQYPGQEPKTRALAAWLRENTAADATLFVWGHFTPIYYLAERGPGTRFYNTAMLVGDFDPEHLPERFDFTPYLAQADVALALQDLERRRPAYAVDTVPANIHSWGKVPFETVPTLAAYVWRHYREVARPGGAIVYRRID